MLEFLRRLSRKKPVALTPAADWSLQQPLFSLSKRDPFTIGNAVENVLIAGGIGSGKTSASGFALAMSYLTAGFGALILCAKPEEPRLWRRYAKLAGRLDVLSTFTSMADVLNRGLLRDLFTQGSNIDPIAIEQGKIVVVALSLKEYGQIGLYAAALWKFAFQKSIERRDVTKSSRPVVLWQDEGQFFLLPSTDFLFTSTSRSARVSNVLLTQSISGVVATLGGGPAGKAEADAYLSNYGTKIFHANTDPASNEYAANLIGRCKQFMISANNNYGGDEGWAGYSSNRQTGSSSGVSEIIDFELQPREFSKLRTGGEANRRQVDAIVFKNGAAFKATARNWMKVTFSQDLRG